MGLDEKTFYHSLFEKAGTLNGIDRTDNRFNPNLTREIVGAVRKGVGKTTVMRFTNACNCVPTNAKPDCTSLCFSMSLHLESLFPRLESLTEVTSIFTAFGL